MFDEFHIINCKALTGYKLNLIFKDGKQGIVDLSYLVGKGVFSNWTNFDEFAKVKINKTTKTVCWGDDIDLDPIALKNKLQ